MNLEPWSWVLRAREQGCWCTYMISYQRQGWDTRVLAIGWCLRVPLRLRLESRLSQMMTDDWVVPLAPLRLSLIIPNKAMLQVLVVTLGSKKYALLIMWVVLLGYICNLTIPASYKTMLGRVCLGYCSWIGSWQSWLIGPGAMYHCFQDPVCWARIFWDLGLCVSRQSRNVTRRPCLKLRYH